MMNPEYNNLQAWDDEDGQAYVSGTHDVDIARNFYREVYLPDTFGDDETSEEWGWGISQTEGEPEPVWVPVDQIEEERWEVVHKVIQPNTIPVLIWVG